MNNSGDLPLIETNPQLKILFDEAKRRWPQDYLFNEETVVSDFTSSQNQLLIQNSNKNGYIYQNVGVILFSR